MNDPRIEFFSALQSGGVGPANPSALVADGLLHRHRIEGDRPGTLNGWHVLHLDSPASGAGGSWKAAHSVKWCSKRLSALTASERAELSRRITEDRERAQVATEARHRAAAAKAVRIWADSAPAAARHPYLDRKGIAPGIARQCGGALVLPIVDFTGTLHGLQFIAEDGGKKFLSGMAKQGHFIPSGGTPSPDRPLWITEGHATACTLSALQPGVVVIAACDAGNLLSVATEARKRWSGIDLVVCPDFDAIGRQKGQEAAEKARARIMKPDRLPSDLPAWVSDWNDWQQFRRQGVRS
ncbi:toprim domain-containing protein [Acidithiobacillus sp.]